MCQNYKDEIGSLESELENKATINQEKFNEVIIIKGHLEEQSKINEEIFVGTRFQEEKTK